MWKCEKSFRPTLITTGRVGRLVGWRWTPDASRISCVAAKINLLRFMCRHSGSGFAKSGSNYPLYIGSCMCVTGTSSEI
jgi:hypothetical protein